ncbi:MAG TPA: CHAT domain-containing protein [Chthoniobacterales bacterium]|nr:CHAT domain-containing protein [Chthoniobacterales bacterium]
MLRNCYDNWYSSTIRPTLVVLSLIALGAPPHLCADEAKTSPTATAKPDRAQLETQFKKADAGRAAAREKTKERADAARNAMQIASDIAWLAFDAGKFDEAATWFAKSAELKEDGHVNARAYWEDYERTTAVEEDGKVDDHIKRLQTQLETAEESKKEMLRKLIHGFEKNRYITRYNTLSTLEQIARDNNDGENLLKYTMRELEIRRLEMGYLEKAKAPKDEINQKNVHVATALERVSGAQADLALFEQAEKSGLEALALRRALPEEMADRKLDESLATLARMYVYNMGDLVKARDYYQQALASIEASAAVRKKALSEDRFYTAEQKAAMSKEERAKHEEMEAQTRDMTVALDCMSQALALANLGGISQEEGDLKAGLSYYQRALQLAEGLPKGGYINIFEIFRARIRARVLGDLASLHAESGEADLALKALNETIALRRSIGQDDWTAQAMQQAADLAHSKGDNTTARHFLEQARQIFAAANKLNNVVSATGFLAVIARDEGKLDEAASRAAEALLLARKTGNLGVVSGSARTFASIRVKQNKLEEAKTLIEEARVADTRTGSISDRIGTLGIEGELLEAKGENEKALEVYREAVKLVESVRATAASETAFADVKRNYRPYERIVRTLIKLNRADEAFDYLNRAKSKKLQESLRLSSMKSGDKTMQALLDRANGLETKLNAATTQLRTEEAKPEAERDKTRIENLKTVVASTQGEFRRVVEQIKSSNPNWEKFMTVNPKALKETQRSIPPGVMLVQYAPVGEQLYIFLVSKESLKIAIAPGKPEDLWKKITAVRKQITTGESGGPLTKNLVALYDLLIAPIETDLAPIKTIAFIPNQLLFYLPMQALAKKNAAGELRYLIEDKEIVYLTAADVMNVVQPPDSEKSPGGMVAFGNPTGANLPAAEAEVKAIAQVFPATEVLSGGEVTKVALNTEQRLNKRIVHFATHGILNATTPADSYIQLATATVPGQDHLTVGEVWDLPLQKVTLVTLSACESALGDKEPDGGEITTLAEAFSSAGATTVLASLWSVGDESTKELMVEFYRQLAAGQSQAAALQSAEIKLLKNPKFSRPLYWAPFVLMGDWR